MRGSAPCHRVLRPTSVHLYDVRCKVWRQVLGKVINVYSCGPSLPPSTRWSTGDTTTVSVCPSVSISVCPNPCPLTCQEAARWQCWRGVGGRRRLEVLGTRGLSHGRLRAGTPRAHRGETRVSHRGRGGCVRASEGQRSLSRRKRGSWAAVSTSGSSHRCRLEVLGLMEQRGLQLLLSELWPPAGDAASPGAC